MLTLGKTTMISLLKQGKHRMIIEYAVDKAGVSTGEIVFIVHVKPSIFVDVPFISFQIAHIHRGVILHCAVGNRAV